MGKPEIVQEIKNAYLQTSNPLMEEIQKFSDSANIIELKKCYHKMKSGCGNVGFVRLQKMCELVEEALRGGAVLDTPAASINFSNNQCGIQKFGHVTGDSMNEPIEEKFYVVLMDDSMADLAVAGLLVQKYGYEPRPFDNYPKLLKFLREEKDRVKLILLDNEMPGLTGIDVLKRLKKEVLFKDIPVVMMTGDSAPATVYRAVTCGAANYLVKPLSPQVFEEKLKKFIPQKEPVKALPKKPTEAACQNKIDLKFPGMVASIGETTMTLRTDYRVGAGAKFVIDTPFLNEVGIRSVPLKVEECIEIPNGFHLRCSLAPMDERDLEMFQKYYRSLIRAGASVPVAG